MPEGSSVLAQVPSDSEQRIWVQAVSWQIKGHGEVREEPYRKGKSVTAGHAVRQRPERAAMLDPRLEAVGISAELMNQTYPR